MNSNTPVLDADRPATASPRTPWQVRLLATLVGLLALVTSYGAIYFSFYFENPDPGLGSWAFVVLFLAINVTSVAAASGLVRGSATGWRVLVGWGVLGILWCIAKLVFWHETEALVFGVLNVGCLALLAARRTREHAGA